jgi:hypothetical protein
VGSSGQGAGAPRLVPRAPGVPVPSLRDPAGGAISIHRTRNRLRLAAGWAIPARRSWGCESSSERAPTRPERRTARGGFPAGGFASGEGEAASGYSATPFSWRRVHTFSGVMGMSMWVTPKCASASTNRAVQLPARRLPEHRRQSHRQPAVDLPLHDELMMLLTSSPDGLGTRRCRWSRVRGPLRVGGACSGRTQCTYACSVRWL